MRRRWPNFAAAAAERRSLPDSLTGGGGGGGGGGGEGEGAGCLLPTKARLMQADKPEKPSDVLWSGCASTAPSPSPPQTRPLRPSPVN